MANMNILSAENSGDQQSVLQKPCQSTRELGFLLTMKIFQVEEAGIQSPWTWVQLALALNLVLLPASSSA